MGPIFSVVSSAGDIILDALDRRYGININRRFLLPKLNAPWCSTSE